jgi:hypothetical protein
MTSRHPVFNIGFPGPFTGTIRLAVIAVGWPWGA